MRIERKRHDDYWWWPAVDSMIFGASASPFCSHSAANPPNATNVAPNDPSPHRGVRKCIQRCELVLLDRNGIEPHKTRNKSASRTRGATIWTRSPECVDAWPMRATPPPPSNGAPCIPLTPDQRLTARLASVRRTRARKVLRDDLVALRAALWQAPSAAGLVRGPEPGSSRPPPGLGRGAGDAASDATVAHTVTRI